MVYATETEIDTRRGTRLLDIIADTENTGDRDTDAIARGLSTATSKIDSYLSARYPVPLTTAPDFIVGYCCDMAIYEVASGADVLTEIIETRNADAIAHLRLIAQGKADLGLPETGQVKTESPQAIQIDSEPKRFGRNSPGNF